MKNQTHYSIRFYRYIARNYNMTMNEFTNATGLTRDTVLRTITGETVPTIGTRQKLLKVLSAREVNALIGGIFYDG